MSIFVDQDTRVLVQGITGHQGSYHTEAMLDFGTEVVAGVTPGKGGEKVKGVPVFDSVSRAVEVTAADTSIIFVPAPYARDAVIESIEGGVDTVVVVTENIPLHDTMEFTQYALLKGVQIIGPNCPGVCSPGGSKVGIMPNEIFTPGHTGVVSRSGTLTYEVVNHLTEAGIGQSTCVGIGGDPVIGTDFVEVLSRFEEDGDTDSIVLIGEIGGTAEEEAAEYIQEEISKPVVSYIAGLTAPAGKKMGHAGAIVSGGRGSADSKIRAMKGSGAEVAMKPSEIPELLG